MKPTHHQALVGVDERRAEQRGKEGEEGGREGGGVSAC